MGTKPGQDLVQCDGSCAVWLHRGCARISKVAFEAVCKSLDPSYCPQCILDKQALEISMLRDMVSDLSSQFVVMRSQLFAVSKSVTKRSIECLAERRTKGGEDGGKLEASVKLSTGE